MPTTCSKPSGVCSKLNTKELLLTLAARRIKRIYKVMEYFGLETGAFSQLTQQYMENSFNPRTPNIPDVKYYSYGASLEPTRWSVFAPSHAIIKPVEGLNDGLVRYYCNPRQYSVRPLTKNIAYPRVSGATTKAR